MEQTPSNPENEYTKSAITYLQFDRYYENLYKEYLARKERYNIELNHLNDLMTILFLEL